MIGDSKLTKNNIFWSKFQFEVVTVNLRGKIIKIVIEEAEFFVEYLGDGVQLDMVKIPGGSFIMGSPKTEKYRSDNDEVQLEMNVSEFCLGKYVVTQKQYAKIMGRNPSRFKGERNPVENVSLKDAIEFTLKLSQKTGRRYKLPNEVQWEYACRAKTTTPFHFGETITTDLANYDGNYTYADESKGKCLETTVEVGMYRPNAFGLYDMHGNIWEWCRDNWHNGHPEESTDDEVSGDVDNKYEIIRGGSWIVNPRYCRSGYRSNCHGYSDSYDTVGFRVCCEFKNT